MAKAGSTTRGEYWALPLPYALQREKNGNNNQFSGGGGCHWGIRIIKIIAMVATMLYFTISIYILHRSADNNFYDLNTVTKFFLFDGMIGTATLRSPPSSQLADVDVFKYTLSRPPPIRVPSYHYHIVHSVLTRFMVGQPDQTTLAKSRLKLFKTFCHLTMIHKMSQNYHWQVLVDPGLDGLIIHEIKSLLAFSSPVLDNVYMIMMNNMAWMQDGKNKEREMASYGVSLHTIATEYDRGNLNIITGNKAHLIRTLEWYNNWKKCKNLIVIETLLDADGGMHSKGIEGIQEIAVKYTTMNHKQNQTLDRRQKAKSKSPPQSSSLVGDWWILCGTDHIEWHNWGVYKLSSDEYKKVGITSGVVGIRSKPKECISAGYTRVGLVTKNPKIVTMNKSDGVNYDFPLLASLNHYSATSKYSTCTTNVVTHCYRRFFEDRLLIIRTRSIMLDGMTHLDPELNSYNVKTTKNPDTFLTCRTGSGFGHYCSKSFLSTGTKPTRRPCSCSSRG